MRCYPLIDMDASGLNKQPMFMATGEQILRNRTKFYLTEERPGHYRLRARDAHRMLDYLLYNIHCPKCGKAMQFDDIHIDETSLLAILARPATGRGMKISSRSPSGERRGVIYKFSGNQEAI